MGVEHDAETPGVYKISADTEPGGRATVALVLSEIKGLRDFTDARFNDLQRQLDAMARLPARVDAMNERQILLEARIKLIEDSDAMKSTADARKREYRAGTLPLIVLGFLGTIVNVVVVLAQH